jgi:ferredoxin-type protein NapF
MQLLRGDFAGRAPIVRPPWAVAESAFIDRCTRCGDCVDICPSAVIVAGRGGYPQIDFSSGECDFCGRCVRTCKAQALIETADTPPWPYRADVSAGCLAHLGVVCRTCGEQCDSHAIRFRPVAGRVGMPQIDMTLCTGCGACVAPCPVNAMRIINPALSNACVIDPGVTSTHQGVTSP